MIELSCVLISGPFVSFVIVDCAIEKGKFFQRLEIFTRAYLHVIIDEVGASCL